ncbi:MAG: glutamine synthetase type III, partial [Clostridia bacterium]|nr:glutamine synthetase type III [Clostridia bacterium]
EAVARGEIALENYVKTINIEALTMLEMAKRDVIPAISDYVAKLCSTIALKQSTCNLPSAVEKDLAQKLSLFNDEIYASIESLENLLKDIDTEDWSKASQAMAKKVVPAMEKLRKAVDGAEELTSANAWPYPTYSDILYRVR